MEGLMFEGQIVWNMQTTLDREVASPGETVHIRFALQNALNISMFIDAVAWNTNFYPVEQAVTQEVKQIIGPNALAYLCAGTVRVPDVPTGQYRIDVVA